MNNNPFEMFSKFGEIKKTIESTVVEGSSGGGMVKVIIKGNMQITSLSIDEMLFKSGDKEMLESMIIGAVNDALKKLQDSIMKSLLPFGNGLPPFGGE